MTFVVRPLKMIRTAALAAVVIFGITHPVETSPISDQIIIPANPITAARAAVVRQVESELSSKMRTGAGEARSLARTIVQESEAAGVDPLFVLAIIEAESNFDPDAVSKTGARGLMQIVPKTFRMISATARMFDPIENVRVGIRYLRHLRDSGFGKRSGPEGILLAYNQGPGNARDIIKGERERPDEARIYIPKVMHNYHSLLKRHGKNPRDARKLFIAASR